MIRIKEKTLLWFMMLFSLIFAISVYSIIREQYALVILLPVILFLTGLVYCLRSIYDNIFLFCFLLCFFTFLLCGQTINRVYQIYGYNFSDNIELHTDLVLFISLIGVLVGYLITKYTGKEKSISRGTNYNTVYCKNIKKISKILFFCTYFFWILTLLDTVLFTMQYGYTAYYLSYSSRVPAIIRQIGYMAPMSFFIFLATMPSKKEAKLPIALYMAYSVISLGTGRRIHFMVALIFIFSYMMFRNKVEPEEIPWVTKKMIVKVLIAIPVLLMAMYMFEYIRSEYSVGSATEYSPLIGFFVRQGTSVNVIKYTELFSDRLNPNALYSFSNTIEWMQNGFLGKLFGFDSMFEFGNQSVQTATAGTYLADFVSYNANPTSYSVGVGYGSCYIEELYVDFGYLGVFIGNIFYGFLLSKLSKTALISRNIWLTAIGFFMVNELFKAPRATFDACFGRLLYFSYWGPLVLIYVFVTLSHKRK